MRKCEVPNCIEKHYARNYCRNHYLVFVRKGFHTWPTKKCKVISCNTMVRIGAKRKNKELSDYCNYHVRAIKAGWVEGVCRNKGENHYRWNGGKSPYPDHNSLKKIRQMVFERDNFKCIKCGKEAKYTHHIDCTKDNHIISNLISICASCHVKLHTYIKLFYRNAPSS